MRSLVARSAVVALCLLGCGGTQDARSESSVHSHGDMSDAEYQCRTEHAEQSGAHHTRTLEAYGIWAKNMLGLTRQFQGIPWARMPPAAQAKVRARFEARNAEKRAEIAAARGVKPDEVQLGCTAEFPHCMDLSHPSNHAEVGQWYLQVVVDALGAFDKQVSEAESTELRVVEVLMATAGDRKARPVAKLDALVAEARASEEELGQAHAKLLGLLVKGAAVAEVQLPRRLREPDCVAESR